MDKNDANTAGSSEDLQFDHAEFKEAGEKEGNETACQTCKKMIEDVYFEESGKVICGACREDLEKAMARGGGAGRFFRAVLFGVPAAALGSGIYYGISALTGYEFGLVAIIIGLMVGGAVRMGSNNRGGWFYQGLAMILTYLAIVTTYIPIIHDEFKKGMDTALEQPMTENQDDVALDNTGAKSVPDAGSSAMPKQKAILIWTIAWLAIIMFACAAPFLAGLENIIGLIIIGIGLYEAWKLNKRTVIRISGPFEIAAAGTEEAPADA